MGPLGVNCSDKIIVNGVDLVNQDELSQGQLRELQRYIDENSHLLKFMERPNEEPKENRFTKSPTPSRYGTIRSRIGYPADPNDGYQTLGQKFGLPNRDQEIDYEKTETYHRAPKLDFNMDQWNRTYGKQSNVNLSIENLHVGAPPGGWESLSSGRPSPYSTIDRKGSLRRSVGPSEKRVTIDPNYRSSSVDRPSQKAMQNLETTQTRQSNQIVHQAYNQGTQSLGRSAARDTVYSAPFDPNRVAREGITGRDASYYSSVVSGLDEPEVTRSTTTSNYRTNSYGSTQNAPTNSTITREISNYGTGNRSSNTNTANRGSGVYDRVYEPSSGYNTTQSTDYTTIKNAPSSGYNSGYSTVKTIHTTAPTPPAAAVLDPERIFNSKNSENVYTTMRYEKGPRDVTTIGSTIHLEPGEDPQKKIDEIYKSLMQIR